MLLRTLSSYLLKTTVAIQTRNMANPSKLAKLTSFIGTHDNTFHCDDVTACFMLKQLDRFKDHDIVRTRDPEILGKADIVVDVGAEFDVDRLRLDHHQRSFTKTIKDFYPKLRTTNPDKAPRLSSSGLVYAVFGKDLITTLLDLGSSYSDLEGQQEAKTKVDLIFEKAYTEFFEEIDAIDNGVEIAAGDNVVYNYNINSGISSRVGRLNPVGKDVTPELRMEQFKKAMELVGGELIEGFRYMSKYWYPTRQEIRKVIMNRKQFHPSGQVVLLNQEQLVGWKSAFIDIEEELNIVGELKYVIFTDGSEASPWRATGVPTSLKSFSLRAPLKEEWRGKRDEELQKVSGVPDATFVHNNGFTGGAKSLAGVMSLVNQTLGLPDSN